LQAEQRRKQAEQRQKNTDRLANAMKRLTRVRVRIDDFVPAEKSSFAVIACDESQAMHDSLLAQADSPIAEESFVKLDKSIETAERVFGFLEQVCASTAALQLAGSSTVLCRWHSCIAACCSRGPHRGVVAVSQLKVLLQRIYSVEIQLTSLQAQSFNAKVTKTIAECAAAVVACTQTLHKLERSIRARSGHDRLAGPGGCTCTTVAATPPDCLAVQLTFTDRSPPAVHRRRDRRVRGRGQELRRLHRHRD
jgi:hypothetical protein